MQTKKIVGVILILGAIGGVWFISNLGQSSTEENGNMENTNQETARATITTTAGEIVLDLYPKAAPKTVENFLAKAQSGYFNGLKFHRVEDWVIQGGDPLSRDSSQEHLWGTGGGDIETELSDLPFVEGALGVARGPEIRISNDSQFFIVKKDSQFLNKQYTLFGQVVEGMDVVQNVAVGDDIISIVVE